MKAILCFPYPYSNQGNLAALALAMGLWNKLELSCLMLGATEETLSLSMPLPIPVVRLIHPSLDGMDALALGYIIAEFFRAEKADILILGDRIDAEGIGLIPAVIAQHLLCPLFSQVDSVQLEKSGQSRFTLGIRAGGKKLELSLKPPAVFVAARSVKAIPIISTSATISNLDWASLRLDPMKLVARPNQLGDLYPAHREVIPTPLANIKQILAR